MSVVQADPIADPSVTQILRQLCRALNPVKALRRRRPSTPNSTGGKNGSRCRRGLQNSIEVLNVAFSIAETIPGVGPPLKGALEALYKTLRQVEERFQNAEASAELIDRLAALAGDLSVVENPDPILAKLTKRLYSIRDELDRLMYEPGVNYSAIAKALAGFTSNINSCQLDFLVVTQVELVARTRVTDVERINMQCVQVVDPFGFAQRIRLVYLGNPKMVADVILGRYDVNPVMRMALDGFISQELYELTVDDGHHIQSLTNALTSQLSKGTTLVMSVVILEIIGNQTELRCPTCKLPIPISEGDDREVCESTTCERRVSAVRSKEPADAEKQITRSEATEFLFRNILIRHTSTTSGVTEVPLSTTSGVEEIAEVDEDAGHSGAEEGGSRDGGGDVTSDTIDDYYSSQTHTTIKEKIVERGVYHQAGSVDVVNGNGRFTGTINYGAAPPDTDPRTSHRMSRRYEQRHHQDVDRDRTEGSASEGAYDRTARSRTPERPPLRAAPSFLQGVSNISIGGNMSSRTVNGNMYTRGSKTITRENIPVMEYHQEGSVGAVIGNGNFGDVLNHGGNRGWPAKSTGRRHQTHYPDSDEMSSEDDPPHRRYRDQRGAFGVINDHALFSGTLNYNAPPNIRTQDQSWGQREEHGGDEYGFPPDGQEHPVRCGERPNACYEHPPTEEDCDTPNIDVRPSSPTQSVPGGIFGMFNEPAYPAGPAHQHGYGSGYSTRLAPGPRDPWGYQRQGYDERRYGHSPSPRMAVETSRDHYPPKKVGYFN